MVTSLIGFFSDFKEREKLEDLLNYVKIEKFIKLSKVETAITDKKLVLTGTFNAFFESGVKVHLREGWGKGFNIHIE